MWGAKRQLTAWVAPIVIKWPQGRIKYLEFERGGGRGVGWAMGEVGVKKDVESGGRY